MPSTRTTRRTPTRDNDLWIGLGGLGAAVTFGWTLGTGGVVLFGAAYLTATFVLTALHGRSWLGALHRRPAGVLAIVFALVAVVGLVLLLRAEPRLDPRDAAPGTALATVALLDVRDEAPSTGYARENFGPAWADVDRNGCDTRNDILVRDLDDVTYQDGSTCVVASGTLDDLYSGTSIPFDRGPATSSSVQIDHVIPLSDAWRTGAQDWDDETRREFANDPLNLMASQGRLNSQKGDSDTAAWLPPNEAFRCTYVARQVGVKYAYALWVTETERDAMIDVLSSCPDEPLPTE